MCSLDKSAGLTSSLSKMEGAHLDRAAQTKALLMSLVHFLVHRHLHHQPLIAVQLLCSTSITSGECERSLFSLTAATNQRAGSTCAASSATASSGVAGRRSISCGPPAAARCARRGALRNRLAMGGRTCASFLLAFSRLRCSTLLVHDQRPAAHVVCPSS